MNKLGLPVRQLLFHMLVKIGMHLYILATVFTFALQSPFPYLIFVDEAESVIWVKIAFDFKAVYSKRNLLSRYYMGLIFMKMLVYDECDLCIN